MLEARKSDLEARLADMPDIAAAPILHPGISETYRRKIRQLTDALNAPETLGEASNILRSLIEKVVIRALPEGHELRIYGELGAIL